ncbi:MAG TPA: carboxypeptidase-like regulatory domain-containing protein, partial [Thermoanaerobaculia bacterium]|nr:carboxypeptidase-like regulatory domain-containing protein [Thermoanaerobaculia bacterium]
QLKPRKLGELELVLSGLSATVDPLKVTVPKNTASGVRISIRGGAGDATIAEAERLLGGPFVVEGDLAGPGLAAPVRLPQNDVPNSDPLLVNIPPLPQSGNYTLSNLRITRNGATALDITPNRVDVEVIEQVLITSVTTRPLTLEEIRNKGIILDDDSYLGFEFTLGVALDSKAVDFTFPVVFDKRGVAVPQPLLPGSEPERAQMPPLTTIIPMLLSPDDGQMPSVRLPNGQTEEVRIPSVLVIPGNVGYLKQFFSAKLFVANGAPGTSNLTVRDVTGTIKLPPGADRVINTADDPLMLPDTTRGPQPKTMPVVAAGQDGLLGTGDDVVTFGPGAQGEAEFLLRGEKEGFHQIDFDIAATLDGLVTGPVTVTGSGSGGVLVRNPFFDMTFAVPAIVRRGEPFKMFVTVNNISQALANDVQVTLDGARMSGARIVGDTTKSIDTLQPRDSRVLEYDFIAERTGQVVATYLNLETDNGSTGRLKFTLAIGERGVPLSPDTLVLPVAVDYVPQDVVSAAMRVLGQAWSIANAPSGTLPKNVTRISRGVVTQKALALAEAGLRISLGQPAPDAVRDLLFDFYGAGEGPAVDAGFDQLLRTTNAGTDFARAIGNALKPTAETAGGAVAYERSVSSVAASGPNFVAFAFGNAAGAPVTATLSDFSEHESVAGLTSNTFVNGSVMSAVAVPFGTTATAARLVLVASPVDNPYKLVLTGTGSGTIDVSVTLPAGGAFRRGTAQLNVVQGGHYRIIADTTPTVDIDANGDTFYETEMPMTLETLSASGPRLISATTIGPETLSGAAPFGFQTAILFDRIVGATTASNVANYTIPNNRVFSAKRQLSGRLVFATLEQPEGPYVATQLSVNRIDDLRGVTGPAATVSMGSRLEDIGAVVSGRILSADGTPIPNAVVTYLQNPEILCTPPLGDYAGLTNVRTNDEGRYELRYVRQDQCGMAFQIATKDPNTAALRSVSSSVRAAGEQIVLDIAMLGRGSVTGFVRALNGSPVAGATVVALSQTDPQSHGSVQSDSSGRYTIDGIVVGPVTVRAVKDAALGKSFGRIDRAGTAANVDLVLDGGTVTAKGIVRRVQGSDIQAVPGLQVVYRVRATNGFDWIPVDLTITESNGSYLFTGLPTGEYRIEALLNSRDRGAITGIAAAGDVLNQDIAIVLGNEGYGTVRGVVRFPDGQPAGGVVISVDDRGVLSNADGTFELTGLLVKPATEQFVKAQSRDGLRNGGVKVLISQPNQVISNVAITLSGVGTAVFTLLDANRNPVVGQEVDLLGSCWNPCGCAAKTTDSQGKVTFTNVRLGTVQARALRTQGETWDQADATISLKSDSETAFGVLIFPGTGSVTGTVLNPDGTPAMGADIRLRSKVFDEDTCSLVPGASQRVRTDSLGKFRFNGVNVGQVSVTATHPFFTTSVGAQGVIAANGSTTDFQLRLVNTISGVLSGTVYLPDGVTPAGAGVEVTAVGPLPEVTVATDANGRYEFAKIFPEGTYTLTARDAITGGLRRDSINLKAGQDVTHDIRLKGKGTVLVRVTDGAGQPVQTAFVRLEETQFPNRIYESAISASNGGVATFENVFEGPVTAQANDVFARGGRASSTLAGPGATLEMTVALTTTGTVKGHFRRADGTTPIPFGSVKLVVAGRIVGSVTTDGVSDIGAFSFNYVPAGSFRLEAQDPQTARSGIAVGTIATEGETVDVDIVAQGVGRVEGTVTSNGAPQPLAHVRITSGNNFDVLTYADQAGRYAIDGVPQGRITVTATLSGNFLTGTNSGNLDGEGDVLTLDVALRDSGRVTGHVYQAGGTTAAPLSLVTVQVGGTGGAKLETTTDAAGAFAFERVPAGFATLNAEVLGSIDKAGGVADVVGSQTTNVTLTLNGVGAISGRALDSA